MDFKHTTLDNGLTVIAEINPTAASMAAGFFTKTGSRDETTGIEGVSHFLEHMIFKGTERRNAFDVNLEFDRMGANYNAFTSSENTVFFGAVLPEFQSKLLDLLGDILRPSLRQKDFDMEKNVILDEIARYEDMPSFRCFEKLMAEHFDNHPLGNSVLGTPDSIRELKRDDMQAYFDRRYSPGNVTVVGTGRIDFDAFVEKVNEMCSHWKPYDVSRQTQDGPKGENSRQVIITDKKVSREHIGIMSPAPSHQDHSRYAAQLAAAVIGDVTGSRLYYALIETAIADEAHMAHDPFDHTGAFLTFISCDAERASKAVKIATDVFRKFMDSGPTEEELQAAKNKIASSATLKGELSMGRLTSVGFDWVYCREYEPLTDQIETMFKVTRDEVTELIRNCNPTASTLLALGPLEAL